MSINVTQTISAQGFSTPIQVSRHNQAHTSYDVQLSNTATYTVQYTLDQFNRRGVTPVWRDLPSATNETADSSDVIQETPIEGVRLNVTALSGEIRFKVLQNS